MPDPIPRNKDADPDWQHRGGFNPRPHSLPVDYVPPPDRALAGDRVRPPPARPARPPDRPRTPRRSMPIGQIASWFFVLVLCGGCVAGVGVVNNLLNSPPPTIVSFTVDQSNVSVGTRVHFTVELSKPFSFFAFGRFKAALASSYSDISGGPCSFDATNLTTCIDLNSSCNNSTTCTFVWWEDSPLTEQFGAFIQDTSNFKSTQVGDAQTLTVMWS